MRNSFYLMFALSDSGHADLAYSLLLKEEFPSWLFQVKMGATTIWEHWDSIYPDGTVLPEDGNSFNHGAFGSVGVWLFEAAAGINADEKNPGYRHIIIKPVPDQRFSFLRGRIETMYGTAASSWELADGKIRLNITIPPNTCATLHLPDSKNKEIFLNGQRLDEVKIPEMHLYDGEKYEQTMLDVGSGEYRFEYAYT